MKDDKLRLIRPTLPPHFILKAAKISPKLKIKFMLSSDRPETIIPKYAQVTLGRW